MNVAITGACGLLGAHLAAALSKENRVVGFDRHPWWGTRPIELHRGDLGDADARAAFMSDARPDLLIHCIAMVDVDRCEQQPEDAYFANGTLTGLIAGEAPARCRVMYVTTDGIFDGVAPMRTERDLPCPRTVYGRSKLHGEWETQLAMKDHLIVRTNFFGWSAGIKNTSAEWLYDALGAGEPITLFDDFWFTPLYVVDLVERMLALVEARATGIFHIGGANRVSKYQFGISLAEAAGFSTANVRRGSIAQARLRAPRPHDMSLDSSKLAAVVGRAAPGCASGVTRFIADRGKTLEERVAGIQRRWRPGL